MKKKDEELPIRTIIITLILLVLLIIFLFVLYGGNIFKNDFNPEKDVCLGYNQYRCFFEDDSIMEIYIGKGLSEYEMKEKCLKEMEKRHKSEEIIEIIGEGCIKWRPKNKCELNPEADGCVCDEWGWDFRDFKGVFDIDRIKLAKYFNLTPSHLNPHTEYNTTITFKECFLNGICIPRRPFDFAGYGKKCLKSHLSDECEKGNPDWVLDGKCEGEVFKTKGYLNCTTGWTEICRKKIIHDYPCEELKKYILKNWHYCPDANEFVPGSCWGELMDKLYPSDLYDVAIEKGCDIL